MCWSNVELSFLVSLTSINPLVRGATQNIICMRVVR